MSVGVGRVDRSSAPRFGLRFDRGRAQLVLGEPLEAGPVRVESLVAELTVAKGRVSLTEGWRAFRHRRSTLLEAQVSIALPDLARALGTLLSGNGGLGGPSQAEVSLIGAPSSVSIAVRTAAQSVAADVAWGWDADDLLLVLSSARALPRGPRGPIAAAHDLFTALSAELDPTRGALRVTDPLRRALLEALLPAGVRIPSTRGLARSAHVAGGRLVLTAGAQETSEPARDQLEAARSLAGATTALVDGDLPRARRLAGELVGARAPLVRARAIAHATEAGDAAPAQAASPSELAAELIRALEDRPRSATLLSDAAIAYARAEPHAGVAADALVLVGSALAGSASAEADRVAASALGRAALRRLPVDRSLGVHDVALLSRAIELASLEAASARDAAAWEPIVRVLAERATASAGVVIQRAHALALEHAGRPADALVAFRAVLRRQDDDASAAGLARTLEQLERWDEALSAWDRLASLGAIAGQEALAREARFRAASAAEHAGLVEAAIARLEDALEDAPPDLAALQGAAALASRLAVVGRAQEAAVLDRRLPALVDALGPSFAIEGESALVAAIERAIAGGDEGTARACVDSLARLVPESEALPALVSRLESASRGRLLAGDADALRKRAEGLRGEGRIGDAARVLIELFAKTSDAAVLRAAVELAERSGDAATRSAVLDRALAVLPAGAARDAIAARRRG